MSHRIRLLALLGCWGICAVSSNSAANVVVDDFSSFSKATATSGATLAAVSSVSNGVLGGERDLAVQLTGGISKLSVETNAFGSGTLQYAAGAGVVGRAILTYDGIDGSAIAHNAQGLGGVDLTADGNSHFLLQGIVADHPAAFTVLVYDASDATGSTWSSATVVLNTLAIATNLHIPFADFTLHGPGGAADFTNTGAIQLQIYDSGAKSLDVELDALMIVPEPTAIASLLVAVGCGFWVQRRRRG